MGFRYLDQLADPAQIQQFLELADLFAGAGQSAQNIFELSNRLRHSAPMQLCRKRLARNPACQALIDQRRPCGPYNGEQLLAMPKGTLGHTYATALQAMGYDIGFFPEPAFFNHLQEDADYINYRVYATHDIHHILSGFSLDNFGELGVISISVAQFSHPGLAFSNLMAMLFSWSQADTPIDELESPSEQARTPVYGFRHISQGLEMGAAAKPLFPVIWEERFEQNLEELRAELGITPVREGPWSWAETPAIRDALAR
ncbi:Coq4 family protein [Cyanobium sp. WAJ14-Wanaka]|uniref:Coq4 family protein n=1 Tax=Cyanobium sp. WAJ14-Wanaka TaxID=2823725 RepID=UPI0020CCEAA7|nr:Coq4 family protein [Cyanobium sp. WAJ14-Wanaka]MCP9774716.1 pyrroloquinoline quinone biosynthesis protein [Cyanobium sp. WAJ14-Wanaka]